MPHMQAGRFRQSAPRWFRSGATCGRVTPLSPAVVAELRCRVRVRFRIRNACFPNAWPPALSATARTATPPRPEFRRTSDHARTPDQALPPRLPCRASTLPPPPPCPAAPDLKPSLPASVSRLWPFREPDHHVTVVITAGRNYRGYRVGLVQPVEVEPADRPSDGEMTQARLKSLMTFRRDAAR